MARTEIELTTSPGDFLPLTSEDRDVAGCKHPLEHGGKPQPPLWNTKVSRDPHPRAPRMPSPAVTAGCEAPALRELRALSSEGTLVPPGSELSTSHMTT